MAAERAGTAERVREVVRRPLVSGAIVAVVFVVATVLLREPILAQWNWINPDEAELFAQARAALDSPVPFTTWTLATTGPVWPLTLAGLAVLGAPLTIAFGHFLAALLWGLSGWLVFVLVSRQIGSWWGALVALVWWLPIAIVWPVGHPTNFGVLNTETLPVLLILVLAAAWRPEQLSRHPALFSALGVIGALAVGAKYQAAPLVLGVLAVQLIALRQPPRALLRALLFWLGGCVAVAVAFVIAALLTPSFSIDLLLQNITFLGSYTENLGLRARVVNSVTLVAHSWFFWALLALVIGFCLMSTRRVALIRLCLVLIGLATVFGGGMGFPHYLLFLFAAMGLALALPLREGISFPRRLAPRLLAASAVGILSVALIASTVVLVPGALRVPRPESIAAVFSRDSVDRSAALAEACPEGSRAFVWGWAPELYVAYDWSTTMPYMNAYPFRNSAALKPIGERLAIAAIANADCVVDAVGLPFFAFGPDDSLVTIYPATETGLDDFTVRRGLLDCESCTVYVRD